mgnify:CR=1 FL=1
MQQSEMYRDQKRRKDFSASQPIETKQDLLSVSAVVSNHFGATHDKIISYFFREAF